MKNDYEIRGDVTAIFLKRKDGCVFETQISTTDLEKANSYNGTWFLNTNLPNRNHYAVSKESTGYKQKRLVVLHRFILNAPDGYEVDHINHNTLDNTRGNLRTVTKGENQQNRNCCNKTSKSGIRGVHWVASKKRWRAEIQLNKKNIYVGMYKDIEKANKAIIEARRKLMPFSNSDFNKEAENDY